MPAPIVANDEVTEADLQYYKGGAILAYTLVIGTKNWSSWSLRAWLAMKASNAPFEEIVIPLRQFNSAALIQQHSPSMRIPVLWINDSEADEVVFDSLAICETLAERHPEACLWPKDPIARALARSYAAQMHSSFLALRETLHMDFARTLTPPAIDETVKQEITYIQQAWRTALMRFEDDGGFLFGQFSIADCMYAPVVSRFKTYGVPIRKEIEGYVERVMALPVMQEWFAASQKEIADGLPDQWLVDMVRNAR